MTILAANSYTERRDQSCNMTRFYAMEISTDLFGCVLLVRRWGRIGAKGQSKIDAFDDEAEACLQFDKLEKQKKRRGYCPC
jgi:predicted DNA-binding WGR domain protein